MPEIGNTSVFSQTDASNGTGTMPSWLGSAAPSTLDDAGRALQGAVTREWNWRNYTLTSGGTGTALTLTYAVAPAAYYNGQRFAFITNTAVTGSCTLSVNGLAATTIKKVLGGTLTNLASGDIPAGMFVEVAYNTANTCFVWVNSNTPFITDSSGNVGVGINPATRFHVSGVSPVSQVQATSGSAVSLIDSASGETSFLQFKSNSVETARISVPSTNEIIFNNSSNIERFRVDANGNVLVTGSGGIGYGTGSGGTVTQLTSKSTGVTINKTNGQIITANSALASVTEVAFTVTNSTVAATDNIILTKVSGGTSIKYQVFVGAVSAGSFEAVIRNISGSSGSDVITMNFAVIKSVTS